MKTPAIRNLRDVARRFAQGVIVLLALLVGSSVFALTPAPADAAASAASPGVPAKLVVGTLAGGWPPFEKVEDARLSGLSADYLRALVGPSVVIEPAVYPDMPRLLAAMAAGKVDLLMSVARTPEREHSLSFTAPYFRASTSVVVKAGDTVIKDPAQLANARLAIETGFALERSLRERYPRAQIITFADTGSALQAVAQGGADAYLGFTPAIQYALSNEAAHGLRIAFEDSARPSELRFAVARDRIALRDQLDRALATLAPADESAIRSRWLGESFDLPSVVATKRLVLSPAEQAWLHSLPPLSVGFDNDWAPFSYLDEAGRPGGIAADYLDYLSRVLGIRFTRAPLANWSETISAFQRGDLAMLATTARNDQRLKNATLSRAYESYPLVIVVRENEPAARSLSDFAARRIVMSAHIAGSVPLSAYHIPAANVSVAPSLGEALDRVAHGEADVLVGNVAAVDLELKQHYAGELKILGTVGESDSLGFAMRPDLAPLAGLIDRALLAMPLAEKQRIRQKWVAGNANEHGVWSVTAVRLLPLLIGIAVVLAVTLRAYLLLQREVRRRKQTERELAAQLNFQQTMMEMVPYPLIAKDLEGRYIAINRAYEESSGLRRDDVLGLTGEQVQAWGATNTGELERATREMLKTGERTQLELEFMDAAGRLRRGLFWTRVCYGVDGKPSCVLGTMVDITDFRRAEMLARENERRLFDVTRSLPAVVFQLRRDAHGQYSFPYIGGDTQHLLGSDMGVLAEPGKIDFSRVWEQDRRRVLAELERSARTETPIHMEFRANAADGIRWVRAELVPRREAAGSVVWSDYWVDASVEHARAEELARARDLAEAASRGKDDFLAMMSHEIRTPMNGVLGLVEVLERTRLSADQGEMLGMIHESAGALLQILDDLLDYSKIEAGRLTIEAEPIDMRELVDNAVGLLAGRAHEKGLKVRVDIAPEVAASLRGDSVRLRQILFNLLGNAIKFTLAGEVDVRVAVTEQTDAAQTLEMTVEDTGIGIAPDVQARLFEPFVQAESSTTRRFGGTGLGLTICRKLIALMDGALELQSVPGVGTRMTVRLVMPIEARRYKVGGLRGKRGVVAVDDARVAQALVHFGDALGIELRTVAAAELREPAVLAGADLIFVSEGIEVPDAARLGVRVVCLTEKPKPTGYRILDNTVRVSINPISWRGLGAACAAALTGLSTPAPRPRGLADAGSAPPDRERAIASGRLILVAEDHPVNQELIRHQLTLLGFACDVVNDGVEALAAMQQTSYGCLITDCHMPNLSGYELARRVREIEAVRPDGAQRLPILGITANTAPEDLKQCRDAGMDDCLIKPTRLATLREHLSRWFGADGARQATLASAEAAGALPAPEAHGQDVAVEPFVPVDLGHMTQLWGSESTVKALLDSFVTSVRDDVRALPPLLDDANVAQLREWHHRVAGAAGVLQYPPLLAALEQYRTGMTRKTPDALRADGLTLVRKCHAMLDGIEEQAALLA
ncbi:transporter substrate-binding domain-containing protein [Paraburkholderia sp. BCC1885]|uniref:transporter substrate-binding domain-containing protein n=1 Tax=Paraburkholderia sp. BCC1885 TaxID=2562669 RepID=UPI0011839637|nr:transporter substrate-binding domain-containing protein [Paraburkholderia sp. BCC1885]